MDPSLFRDLSNREDSSATLDPDSIFDKYKRGEAHQLAPFRLFETNYNTSCDEDSECSSPNDRKARGPYRKYSFD